MHILSGCFSLLGCCAAVLLACFGTAQAASGTAEIDLLFPQNDTYAPSHVFPVVFAYQNSVLASYLRPKISFRISPDANRSDVLEYGLYTNEWANFSSSDPFMQYGDPLEFLNVEGTWEIEWELTVTNCSRSTEGNRDFGHGHEFRHDHDGMRRRVVFSTKHGAKKPDLTAATSEDSCSNAQGSAFQITETYDTGDFYDNGRPCAMVAETTPTPSPCAVTIEHSAASSASASLTDRACRINPPTWCPEPKKDEGAARNLVVLSLAVGGVALLVVAFGGLGFFVV